MTAGLCGALRSLRLCARTKKHALRENKDNRKTGTKERLLCSLAKIEESVDVKTTKEQNLPPRENCGGTRQQLTMAKQGDHCLSNALLDS